ncbi:MAG: hypothetical protein JWO52_320 [Gammaproteobacteria bacterium]|jgi:uncharacterized protein YndB with AHSA1/START domain|nr:hypothetical protein [Gammaproteobacteria bacterium]
MNDANHVVPAAVQLANHSTSDPIVAYRRRFPVTPGIVCTRRFEASCDKLFGAWVNPSILTKWLFTTATSELHRAEFEPWEGGNWTVVDRSEGEYFAATGQYLQIDRPHRLIFTFGMLQLSAQFVHVAVDITRAAAGSELTLTHEYLPWMGTRSPEKGWHAMFDMLARPALTLPCAGGHVFSS